jgi:hypothetical protein
MQDPSLQHSVVGGAASPRKPTEDSHVRQRNSKLRAETHDHCVNWHEDSTSADAPAACKDERGARQSKAECRRCGDGEEARAVVLGKPRLLIVLTVNSGWVEGSRDIGKPRRGKS